MILSDSTLKTLITSKDIVVDPYDPTLVQPASIDLRLGDHFLTVDDTAMPYLSMTEEIKYREINGDRITLPPHSFILATTAEFVKIPNGITAFVEGRSSIGRMGLFIQNAGWVDSGFEGRITLELYNANSLPIELVPGRRICQLVLCRMDKHAETPYKGKYQGQVKAVGSRIFKDHECHNASTPL